MRFKDTRIHIEYLSQQTSSLSSDDWSGSLEGGLEALVGSSLDRLDLGELNVDLAEGSGVISEDLVGLNDAGLDDLDRLMRSSVSAAHLGVYIDSKVKNLIPLFAKPDLA